jgi:hypothetical protein
MAARGVFTGAAGGAATSGSAFKVCVIADSGFGCVVLAVAGAKVGICFICSVKTAHKRFPKDALYDILKDAPSGKWVLCENNIEGVDIVCAAYKYNVKRVLYFCWPKGAAACVPGKPYIATFVDHAGNRAERAVARLSVLSRYFSYSNVVDVHNQQRQDILDLEYTWVTSNCWFRLFCTLLGMTVTDAYIVMQSKLHVDHPDKGIGLLRFADSLAMEMINNHEEDDTAPRSSARGGRPVRRSLDLPIAGAAEEPEKSVPPQNVHRFMSYGLASEKPGWAGKADYSVQRYCVECREKGGDRHSTTGYCAAEQCGKAIALCRDGSSYHGRKCMELHKERCVGVAAPVYGVPGKNRSSKQESTEV